MSRMEKYQEDTENVQDEKDANLSRISRNQELYQDVYLNKSVVDINNILDTEKESVEEQEKTKEYAKIEYEEKSYSVNDYLKKAHERLTPDNAMRNLDNKDFVEQENEISKLIESIDEKEKDLDLFSDLVGDDADTLVEGQLKGNIFELDNFTEESLSFDDAQLDKALSDDTIVSVEQQIEKKEDNFQDIFLDEVHRKNKTLLPLIIFLITLVALIAVILIIVFK